MKHIINRVLLLAGLLLSSQVAWAQNTTLENFEGATNILGLPRDTANVKEGAAAGRWNAFTTNSLPPEKAETLPVKDWTGKALVFQMYSPQADNGKVTLTLASEPEGAAEKSNYYAFDIPVDWQGWKTIRITPYDIGKKLRVARKPAGWNNITALQFWGKYGGAPKETTILAVDDIHLEPLTDADKTMVVVPPAATVWKNSSFEAPYVAVSGNGVTSASGAQINGTVANGWSDNSSWADVTINYSEDKTNPYSGASSQKIEVKEVRKGAVQFTQPVTFVKNKTYRASVWLRSPEPVTVEVKFQKKTAPYTSLGVKLLQLTGEWQKVESTVIAPDDMEAYFMLRVQGAGTFWVDDAAFEDVSQLASTAPVHQGNMLANASFEAGLGNGWSVRIRGLGDLVTATKTQFSDPRPTIDATTAAAGSKSLKIVIPATHGALVSSPLVKFNFGRSHVASVSLKASRATTVELEIEGSQLKEKVAVGTEWHRFTLTGTLPFAEQTRLWLRCLADGQPAVTLWIDGVMLEEKPEVSPAYSAVHPVELTLSASRPGAVFFDGEPAQIKIANSDAPKGARLAVQVENLSGEVTKLPSLALPSPSITIAPAKSGPRGMWKLRAQVTNAAGKPLSAPVEQIFARLPRPATLTAAQAKNSFFGVHIHLQPEFINLAKAIGARWTRLHDVNMATKWAIVEPQKDQWVWIDEGVNAARAAGLHVLGMIDGAPAWASVKPRATSGYFAQYNQPNAPGAMERWKLYARNTSAHFKGKIDDWEVWNEPYGSNFLAGTAEEYGELLKAAVPEIKAGNPAARVVGIDGSAHHIDFVKRAVAVAPPSLYDIFSYHDYNSSLYGGPTSIPARDAAIFRDILAKQGIPRPLWNTEGGPWDVGSWYVASNGLTPRGQTAQIVRFDVTQMGAGVEKFFLYTIQADSPQGTASYTGLEHDRSIKPILGARAVLASLVDGSGAPTRREPIAGIDEYVFPNGVRVAWSYDGKTHQFPTPKGMRALDIWGNAMANQNSVTLGVEPVYFVK